MNLYESGGIKEPRYAERYANNKCSCGYCWYGPKRALCFMCDIDKPLEKNDEKNSRIGV